MAYGIMHFFPGVPRSNTKRQSQQCIRAEQLCPKAKSYICGTVGWWLDDCGGS